MKPFFYQDNQYFCESIPLEILAKEIGTPAYIYSRSAISNRCQELIDAFKSYPTLICYAVKANSNLSIIREIKSHGFGADLVSVGELERALAAGVNPQKIVFSGVGKTAKEISRALSAGILFFNVESAFEIDIISQVAHDLKMQAAISLRINPNIDAKTNVKIATGLYSTKFGLPESDLTALANRVKNDPNLSLVGIACHIGSQITDLAPLELAANRMAELALALKAQGFGLQFLDLGGGLGIRYNLETPPSIQHYADTLKSAAQRTGLTLVIEPGRSIIGNAGVLLTEVLGVKATPERNFVIIDAAMNDLIRPTLYDAYHNLVPVKFDEGTGQLPPRSLCDFVGPVCETGDFIAKDRFCPLPTAGDLFAIQSCGAYGWSMASQYNSRPRPPEVLVSGEKWRVIRPRESLESLWEPELPVINSEPQDYLP